MTYKHGHQLEGVGEHGEDYTRGIWDSPDGIGERIWVEVHDDGTLTAANDTIDGSIAWGDIVDITGETEQTWGNVVKASR